MKFPRNLLSNVANKQTNQRYRKCNLLCQAGNNGWMDERVLGHFFALSRLNWAGDNLD